MVQRNGMLGVVRLRMLRAAISKYCTSDLASSSSLWAAILAMPINSGIPYFRFLFACMQAPPQGDARQANAQHPLTMAFLFQAARAGLQEIRQRDHTDELSLRIVVQNRKACQ